MTAADWCSMSVSPAEGFLIYISSLLCKNVCFSERKNMHVAHISLCKQRRRSTVNVVLMFPVPGDGCHNVERGHS